MTIVLEKNQNFIDTAEFTSKVPGRFQQMLRSWARGRESMQQHWLMFRSTAWGRQVPYRVWSRHGAYLEMNSQFKCKH